MPTLIKFYIKHDIATIRPERGRSIQRPPITRQVVGRIAMRRMVAASLRQAINLSGQLAI